MKIAIVKERRAFERRVAASPDAVKQLKGQGLEIVVETGAGEGAFFVDAAYEAAGATIAGDEAAALADADVVLKVQRPLPEELPLIKRGAVLIGLLAPLEHRDEVQTYAEAGISAISMELVPRITRAQTMDVLSSQANLAGYKAAVDAAAAFGRAMPMMMTAAGTIKAARVLVMGAGVAGLQAIATSRRLGGVVFATDVRAAAKEQVESLGATFLMVDEEAMKGAETAGGYAREMGEDFQRRQRQLITDALRRIDIVICTALIPGRRAPVLLTREMLDVLVPGSVVADLAVESGGNVEGSQPEETIVTSGGVRIIGYANAPAHIPVDASLLYARNLSALLALLIDKEKQLKIDTSDELIKASLLTLDGAVVNPALAPPAPITEPAAPAAS
ncbi:MAG TPA: Re/Si-specific NAD(P)(+) transhydrogenase subunit alpha [Stellaceae bacterium]|nr:Re/Si-specific NAD(P)(+) transhydrogenase subunit alpha [Stellaceae bacterium]